MKTLVTLRHKYIYRFKKQTVLRFPEFSISGICYFHFTNNFANVAHVAIRMEETFYNISMYLQNINVFEYAQIAQSGPKSTIPDFEGLSNVDI